MRHDVQDTLMKKQHGFTLVELAIVLMIIGLLIGGVLRGQELLKNAQVTATIQQVKAYQGAWATFNDAYSAIPGDMVLATSRIPDCTAGNDCVNGDGNAMIGTTGTGTAAGQPWIDIPNGIATENTQFWKQLALAHLISGVDPSSTTPEWGRSHPVAKMGAGFFINFSNFTGLGGTGSGTGAVSSHFLVLRNPISCSWSCGGGSSTGLCAITPLQAAQIDRKMDDGMAGTGSVIAVSASWMNGCGNPNSGINGPSGYAETISDKACDMMFQIP
jgi:prepilin-type N-terminal cleavage/methylation domain-containing protein